MALLDPDYLTQRIAWDYETARGYRNLGDKYGEGFYMGRAFAFEQVRAALSERVTP